MIEQLSQAPRRAAIELVLAPTAPSITSTMHPISRCWPATVIGTMPRQAEEPVQTVSDPGPLSRSISIAPVVGIAMQCGASTLLSPQTGQVASICQWQGSAADHGVLLLPGKFEFSLEADIIRSIL